VPELVELASNVPAVRSSPADTNRDVVWCSIDFLEPAPGTCVGGPYRPRRRESGNPVRKSSRPHQCADMRRPVTSFASVRKTRCESTPEGRHGRSDA
jgi:hypothetical protein